MTKYNLSGPDEVPRAVLRVSGVRMKLKTVINNIHKKSVELIKLERANLQNSIKEKDEKQCNS